jgi:hypothetical protein
LKNIPLDHSLLIFIVTFFSIECVCVLVKMQRVSRVLKDEGLFREASSGGESSLWSVPSSQNFNLERLQRAFLHRRELVLQNNSTQTTSLSNLQDDKTPLKNVKSTEEKKTTSLVEDVRRNITQWKPNTTYLLCSDVRHLTPPEPIPRDNKSPMFLAFLIPPDSLTNSTGSTNLNSTNSGNNSMIEVTCQIVDLNLLPFLSSSQQQENELSETCEMN